MIKLAFLDSEDNGNEITAFANDSNLLFIEISDPTEMVTPKYVTLDKNTAIKLVKTLKTEINKLEYNG